MSKATLLSKVNPIHIGWSVGTLGVSLLLNTTNIATLFFLVTVLQIEPFIAGALITGSKLYDAFTDPLMGTISDRTRSRWGRRRPYLMIGGIACGVTFAAFFSLPVIANPVALYIAVGLALVLLSTAYTIYNVPYLAMPAEMIDDYHERSVMMSYRSFLIAIGTFVGISVTPFALATMQEQMGLSASEAYRNMGIAIGALMSISMVGSFFGTSKAKFTEPVSSPMSIRERVRLILNNKQFLLFLGIKLTGLFAIASVIATNFFFVTYVMQRSIGIVAYFGIGTLVAQVVGIPIWLALAKRFGKSRILAFSAIGTFFVALSWLLSGPQEPIGLYMLRGFALGLISGGTLLGTQAIFPDIIELDYRRTGLRREGVFAGTISFIEKAAGALSGVVIGGLLSAMHFDKELPPGEQPESAILGIMLCTAIVPALMSLLKLWMLRYFSLSEEQLKNTARVT